MASLMRAYAPMMSIRRLLAVLIAASVLFASALSGTAAASAATVNHDMQMMESGHCQAPPSHKSDHDKSAGKSCCISMCMAAVALAPAVPTEALVLHDSMTAFPALKHYHGLLAEIATPPPRLA